ncbi:hypothetical protein LCGC14_2113800 [marine sediment metagenome]|uniref:Uncharacterized protein n=1 Tax=marine sediment metagenome TaxID=412755 RepID=A0A0F9GJF1_9ZZZZ
MHHVIIKIGDSYYVSEEADLSDLMPQMGMIGQPERHEIHWEDLPETATPIFAPEKTETEVDTPAWMDPNKSPVPVPLKQGDGS